MSICTINIKMVGCLGTSLHICVNQRLTIIIVITILRFTYVHKLTCYEMNTLRIFSFFLVYTIQLFFCLIHTDMILG